MGKNILLITNADFAYRQLLLESQGFQVRRAGIREAHEKSRQERFELALVTTEIGVDAALELCGDLKEADAAVCVAVLAQRSDYIPRNDCVDAVLYEQHSPAEFMQEVQHLIETGPKRRGKSAG